MDGTGYLKGYGNKSLHQRSHGEVFMSTLTKKLRGNGLYIFDEPEAALSPTRQMSAITAIHDLSQNDSQFIIATHSPILLAYPNANRIQLNDEGLCEVSYEDTEHYRITRASQPKCWVSKKVSGFFRGFIVLNVHYDHWISGFTCDDDRCVVFAHVFHRFCKILPFLGRPS